MVCDNEILKSKLQENLNIINNCLEKGELDTVDTIEILIDFKENIENKFLLMLDNCNDELIVTSIIEYFNNNCVCREKFIDLMIEKLNSNSWLVRAYIVEFMGDIEYKKLKNSIKKMLPNVYIEELPRIYYALIRFGEEEYIDKMINLLDHECYRVRIATANLLAKIAEKNSKFKVKIIKELLKHKNDKTRSVRETIINILNNFPNEIK